jgi:hypothetical protein
MAVLVSGLLIGGGGWPGGVWEAGGAILAQAALLLSLRSRVVQ